MTNKVYITKFQPQWNFGPAAKYGEVVFLTEKEHRPEPSSPLYNDRITRTIQFTMQDYVAGADYIVLTAAAIPNMIVAMLLQKQVGPHNILRWNSTTYDYDLYKIQGKI